MIILSSDVRLPSLLGEKDWEAPGITMAGLNDIPKCFRRLQSIATHANPRPNVSMFFFFAFEMFSTTSSLIQDHEGPTVAFTLTLTFDWWNSSQQAARD